MNSICISTDELLLPVLGLDIAKASVQAELRIKGRKVRFGFANNAKGFAQLARILRAAGRAQDLGRLGSHRTLQPGACAVAACSRPSK
jgi:transposase